MLNYSAESKNTHLCSSLFSVEDENDFKNFTGSGFNQRFRSINKYGGVEMMGYLHTGLAGSSKLLLDGVNIRLKFHRNDSSFSLVTSEPTDKTFKIVFNESLLKVRKLKVSDKCRAGLETVLLSSPAYFPLRRVEIKQFTIPPNSSNFNVSNLYLGIIPRRLFICFVSEQSMSGYRNNPYLLKNYNFSRIALTSDCYPNLKPIECNFERNEVLLGYTSMFDALNVFFRNKGNNITKEDWVNGTTIVGVDLTADSSASQGFRQMSRSGPMNLDISFRKNTPETAVLIVYAELEETVRINKAREVDIVYN